MISYEEGGKKQSGSSSARPGEKSVELEQVCFNLLLHFYRNV